MRDREEVLRAQRGAFHWTPGAAASILVSVTARAKGIYGERRPEDVPAYSLSEAAALVGCPQSTLRSWVLGRTFPKRGGGTGRSPAVIEPATSDASFISFTNVVEAHVLAGLRQRYGLELKSIRAAVRYVHEHLGVNHPLAHEQFKTDGVSLFVDRFGHLINATKEGQIGMREVLDAYLQRIDYAADGRAIRFFPLLRATAPRVIVVDPRRSFGRPIIAGTSIPVLAIRERFDAGEDVEQLAKDYDVRSDQIQEALRATPKAA